MHTQPAFDLLVKCVSPEGLLASPAARENYARIWSRDAIMAGIAGGILGGNGQIYKALHLSLRTLYQHQLVTGAIPSNAGFENGAHRVSYGSLAGRVDATTWWTIGAALAALHGGPSIAEEFFPGVKKAFAVLEAWEFNGKGLVYVPLGGNWADEYVVQGYTLYDQLLRLWALEAAAKVWDIELWHRQAVALRQLLVLNFLPEKPTSGNLPDYYHFTAAEGLMEADLPYFPCALAPNGYDMRWDMAANALAMLLKIGNSAFYEKIASYLSNLAEKLGHWMLPAFYPVILPASPDWPLLTHNYRYRFKNEPYHFHNGGAWPIFLGWLGLALHQVGYANYTTAIETDLHLQFQKEQPAPYTFYEYWDIRHLNPGGIPGLAYSASGALLLAAASENPAYPTLLGLD